MTITINDLGSAVLEAEYAVRGPIVIRAGQLELEGTSCTYCNIGNPQSLEQKPLTYLRQLMALCEYPELITAAGDLFPSDVKEEAQKVLIGAKYGLGAYSESKGLRVIREAVAEFISERDGIDADPEAIYLTDGASKGVQSILRLIISTPHDGIMIPIPQYPLYSATLALYEAHPVGYYLDESQGWKLSRELLDEAYASAESMGIKVKAICVINPGNPTGAVLDAENIRMVIRFAQEHNLSILADEVYQENIYLPGDEFIAFSKELVGMGVTDVSLFSFHSTSKGFLGECGHRGGYFEYRNVPDDVADQLLKLQSISLCSNLPGQVAVYAMIRPPKPGWPSYEVYEAEKNGILDDLKERAVILAEGLNKIPGIECQPVAGAMYAFPKITLPPGRTDAEYCMALLEETGMCVVPGSGFGQVPGTAHFRTTILPPTDQIKDVVAKLAKFHASFK
jgi:aspartate/methionine/tyrosine aminotransferase